MTAPKTLAASHAVTAAVNIRRFRGIAFAVCLVVIGLHVHERGAGPAVWTLLVVQFLLYPQLLAFRARRAADPLAAEHEHLNIDAFALALWVAGLGFPLWIAYAVLCATLLNAALNRGAGGLAMAVSASAAGALAGMMVFGYRLLPGTSPLVTGLCLAGSLVYVIAVGITMHGQTGRLAQTRRALSKSESRYRLIAENAGDLIAMLDARGRWLYHSPSWEHWLPVEALADGSDAFAGLERDDRAAAHAALEASIAARQARPMRLRLATPGGEKRVFEGTAQAVNGGDAPPRVVVVLRDVTERNVQRERLEVTGRAFADMTEAVLIADAAGRVVSVNRAFCAITGWRAEEVLGHPEREFRSALQPESFYGDIERAIAESGRWSGTTWARRKDGELYRESRTVSCVRDDTGRVTHTVAIFCDLDRTQTVLRMA